MPRRKETQVGHGCGHGPGTAAPVAMGEPAERLDALLSERDGKRQGKARVQRQGEVVPIRRSPIDELELQADDIESLRAISTAWKRLADCEVGINLVISAATPDAAMEAADALASECGLTVHKLDLFPAIYGDKETITERTGRRNAEVEREQVFDPERLARRMTVLFDHDREFHDMVEHHAKEGSPRFFDFLLDLRQSRGIVCVVTNRIRTESMLPTEFHKLVRIDLPSPERQVAAWRRHLGDALEPEKLEALVGEYPMPLARIKLFARAAKVRSAIEGRREAVDVGCLRAVLEDGRTRGTEVPDPPKPLFSAQA